MAGLVDYAGLFPPAGRSMPDAVAEFASHLASAESWMLGRFVVPAERLQQLAADAARHLTPATASWRLSAIVGDDVEDGARRIRAFNAAHGDGFVVDAAEAKAATVERVQEVARALAAELDVYVEVPLASDPRLLLEAVKRGGVRAKIRTGGVTPDAFPPATAVARFLVRCAELGVPFKATAGLHHPLRGHQRLTYEPDAPCATMFGFLGVFVVAALASAGADEAEIVALLEERGVTSLTFSDDGVSWGARFVPLDQLTRARSTFALSFGSCSFREPVNDLRELGLL